jgi:hypothetical protein
VSEPRQPLSLEPSSPPSFYDLDPEPQEENDEVGHKDGISAPKIFEEVEKEGLSISLPVKENNSMLAMGIGVSHEESLAWKQPVVHLAKGGSTDLRIIHASEYSVDETGRGKLTLVCPDGPRREEADSSSVQMRWL